MPVFDQIFKKYYHPLMIYGLKFLDNENDVHDVLQDVFSTIWKTQKYNLSDEHIKSYLFNSVRNGCLNNLRHQNVIKRHSENEKKNLRYDELTHYQSGEKSFIEKEDLEKIYSAIDSLPDKYKEIIKLSRFEGKKNKEVAEILQIPVRTVETRLFRALKQLREILTEKQIYILLSLLFQPEN